MLYAAAVLLIFSNTSSPIQSLTGLVGNSFELASLFCFWPGSILHREPLVFTPVTFPFNAAVPITHIPVPTKRSEDAMWHLVLQHTCYHCGTNLGFMVIVFMIFSTFSPTVFLFIFSSVLLF